ncbi:RXT2-like protein [Chaetomium strumarium]|uniref:RXT2-like protein n=1 Tax=Chaetomium strumarium TaxID=1170767 RepID=A0AAJ0GP93_9PEZI|nr:RXT2-like protein [Chaetomium strumarium]
MSTQQQAMIMETILGLKRASKRKAYESDSDSSIDQTTNRGNKLKKRARFVRQGRLASSMGPAAYKEVTEHAGYQRAIINRNPPLIDEDGYDITSDDDEEQIQEAVASAMEENPYSSIRLEQILAPLTSVIDLPSHPTLSRPFTSKALTELIEQGLALMQKENAALWKAKPLLTKLVGDNTWAPCGLMTAPDGSDALLFTDTVSFFNRPARHDPAQMTAPPGISGAPEPFGNTSTGLAQRRVGQDALEIEAAVRPVGNTEQNVESGEKALDGETLPDAPRSVNGEAHPSKGSSAPGNPVKEPQVNGRLDHGDENKDGPIRVDGEGLNKRNNAESEDTEMAVAASVGPTTTAQRNTTLPTAHPMIPPPDIQVQSDATETPEELFIHPLFRLPPAAHPDRDLGLPEQEAEEVRRLLLLYVQKQEEICRGTKRLYEGLLKADRYRKTVWRWAKAEAHCGPNRDMSDGEDWYDKEEWGLTEDLKKGEDEVEEDAAQPQKKTRNRK